MLAIVLAAERRLLLSLLTTSPWGYPLIKEALGMLLLVLVETSPASPCLLFWWQTQNCLLKERPSCAEPNSDMHSSVGQPGNALVLIKHLAAPELPSQTTKSVIDLSYLDTVWRFSFCVCKLPWVIKDISSTFSCS